MEAIHLDTGSEVINILGTEISWERVKEGRTSPMFFSFDALKQALKMEAGVSISSVSSILCAPLWLHFQTSCL